MGGTVDSSDVRDLAPAQLLQRLDCFRVVGCVNRHGRYVTGTELVAHSHRRDAATPGQRNDGKQLA